MIRAVSDAGDTRGSQPRVNTTFHTIKEVTQSGR